MDKKWWISLTVLLAFVAGLGLAFGLWQMSERIATESRAMAAENNLTKTQIKLYALTEKYKTCMQAHEYGGRRD